MNKADHNAEHSRLAKQIRVALNRISGVRIVPNQTGFDAERKIKFGLGKGGADLVGIVRVEFDTTAKRVVFGRVLAVEIKTGAGRASPDQVRWLETIRRFGGVAGVVRSVEDAIALVKEARA